MENENQDLQGAENPEEFTGIKVTAPGEVAAGFAAVISSGKHILNEMGPARGWQALIHLNQKDGYDCPGCAWPDPDDERSRIAEYCENGAKAIAEEATTKNIGADFFAANSIADLARLSDFEIGKKGRIAEPVYLSQGATHYKSISWENAFKIIGQHLDNLSSPDEAVFYTSGRTSNEAAFLYQLFVREYGTNNLPDCSNMCHESSGVALTESLGIGKGSVKLEDFYQAEVIIILGQNPGTNHPRMLTALQKAKENGATIISVNPLPETGLLGFDNPQTLLGVLGIKSRLTDLFLQVKINGDMALLKAIVFLLLQEEKKNPGTVFDQEFIKKNTSGFEQYINHIESCNLNELLIQCGILLEEVEKVVEVLKSKNKIIACWAMGLTQHKNSVDSIKEIVNLLLLKGSIGKPGSGTCPVRGHSNVQGDRTMGIYEKPSALFLDNIKNSFGFVPPSNHGYDTVEAIHAMNNGSAKVFVAMGGNFLSAAPDTNYTAHALSNCKLTVNISTKLNRSHLIPGEEALILPCYGRSDKDVTGGMQQFVTTENSMGVIQLSKGNLQPVSENMLSEPEIVCRMAVAVIGERSKVDWPLYIMNYDTIRDDIARTIPGFEFYNERVKKPGGFYLPNAARDGKFDTLTGKANFNIATAEEVKLNPGELLMMTIRSHDQFNTTIYGLDDRYRGVFNERRVIYMNAVDISANDLQPGATVDIISIYNGEERIARRFIIVEFSIPRGCAATYFPETNVLVPINSTAEKSNTPTSKSVVIRIQKHNEEKNITV
ncbi:MAG: FdhF/YdeP family oxidoreductase [Bacteroidota bacterium]